MNAYKIEYEDGRIITVVAETILAVIKKYDLATKANMKTNVFQLEGEQKAIALSNYE